MTATNTRLRPSPSDIQAMSVTGRPSWYPVRNVTPEQWNSVESHFAALNDLPPDRRPGALEAIADPEVRREVESLLQHTSGSATVTSAVGAMAAAAIAPAPERHIGPFRLGR